ncbi:hypothetical protein RUM44_000347 [Polyplax serrata]|uniref:Cytochrome P450 n=1 Tax=Polyplax serrata TaxID=468196 RepID=A0ABR1B572_POLSC
MSGFFLSVFYWLASFVCLWLTTYYIYFKLIGSKYWKRRNVFQLEPEFILGNSRQILNTESIGTLLAKRYKRWKDKKLVGFWSFISPSLLVTDLELIKRILVRDFNHFMDRRVIINEKRDPLTGHLITLKGTKWRNLRVKLTPTFTSGKMKMMFPVMVDCANLLKKYLSSASEAGDIIEFKEVFSRFSTDVISSCAFGIESNCINNPNAEFRVFGKKLLEPGFSLVFRFIVPNFFPWIRNIFQVRAVPKDISDFFINAVKDTMDHREANNIKRNDFMDLLIQLKAKGKIDDVDQDEHENNTEGSGQGPEEYKFSLHQAAAQAFVFFVAGFETSSTTLSLGFYELALHPKIQEKLQQEIDSMLKKYNQEITYEGLMEMDYLDRFIQETLRKHPPVSTIGRECTKEYDIPEMGVKLEKGTRILISVTGLHNDPEHFPEPEVFNPDRFTPEEKRKRDHFAYLPFGEGPRICIGSRFALLQVKVAIVSILSHFNVAVCSHTPIPLVYNNKSFFLTPATGIPLKLTPRSSC